MERDGRKVIQTPAGEQIEVESGAAKGYVGFKQEKGSAGVLTATGWALTGDDVPVDTLLLFEGDGLLASGPPSTERPDLAKEFGAGALKSGFSLVAPAGVIYGPGLHLYAVAGNRASELPRSSSP